MEPVNDRRRLFSKNVPLIQNMILIPGLGKSVSGSIGTVILALLQAALFIVLFDDITLTEFAIGPGGEVVKNIHLALEHATWRSYAAGGSGVILGIVSLLVKFYKDAAANWGVRIFIGIIPAILAGGVIAAVYRI